MLIRDKEDHRYDTSLAQILAHYDNLLLSSDSKYIYYAAMKNHGRYCIFISGNPESDHPGAEVIPMSQEEIYQWIAAHKEDIERELIL